MKQIRNVSGLNLKYYKKLSDWFKIFKDLKKAIVY